MMTEKPSPAGQTVLILNAGSSSLKFAIYKKPGSESGPEVLLRGQFSGIGHASTFTACKGGGEILASGETGSNDYSSHMDALVSLLDWLEEQGHPLKGMLGVGHRIVHGAQAFTSPIAIDRSVLARLESLAPLAPHHMPHNLGAVRHLIKLLPELPQIACFDTAFHSTQPEIETRLAIPAEYTGKGIRRYGFHGLSFEHVVHELSRPGGEGLPERLLVMHLGNGASVCAVRSGKSVATSMGFSTLDGLIMGTRSGALDPGVLIQLLRQEKMSAEDLEDLLYNRSGLLGLSGISGDMQVLLKADAAEARFAVEKFCHAAARYAAAFIPDLGGLDGIVFTGGIGENSPEIRTGILDRLDWLGVRYDPNANEKNSEVLTAPDSSAAIWIVPADEEAMIARHTFALLGEDVRTQ